MNPKRTFLDTIYLLFILGKIFGLSCYDISKERAKYKVSFYVSHFVQFLAHVAVFVALIYLNIQTDLNNDVNSTRIFNQAQQIQMILSLLSVVAGYSEVLLNRQRFWDMVNSCQEVDNQVKIIQPKHLLTTLVMLVYFKITQLLKIEIDHNYLHRFALRRLCIGYSYLAVVYTIFGYYCFVVNRSGAMMVQYATYLIVNSTYILLTTQFHVFMHSMHMRFSTLNAFVE